MSKWFDVRRGGKSNEEKSCEKVGRPEEDERNFTCQGNWSRIKKGKMATKISSNLDKKSKKKNIKQKLTKIS